MPLVSGLGLLALAGSPFARRAGTGLLVGPGMSDTVGMALLERELPLPLLATALVRRAAWRLARRNLGAPGSKSG